MTSSEASALIQAAISEKRKETWMDLGCGSGTFAYALAGLLTTGSRIVAIDKLSQHIAKERNGVVINFLQADLENQVLSYRDMDGILIANTLHYISDQPGFIQRIKPWLKKDGRLVLIEYDTERSNTWVPYPLTFAKAEKLLLEAGFKQVSKIGAIDSAIRAESIFACVAR